MTSLVERARQLAELAKRRSDVLRDGDPAARNRARQLLEHVRAYVLPRAAALKVPLLIVIIGPTGAGKSTLMNTLARAPVSPTGVLRPTTRDAELLATDTDAEALEGDSLAGDRPGRQYSA